MIDLETVVFAPDALPPDEIAYQLEGIPNDSPRDIPREIVTLVEERRATAGMLKTPGGETIGLLVYGIDTESRELIVYALKTWAKQSARIAATRYLEAVARENGCKSLQAVTVRPGLVRQSLRDGWRISEVVLRKDIE